jgi:hypothetical protein
VCWGGGEGKGDEWEVYEVSFNNDGGGVDGDRELTSYSWDSEELKEFR